jgi:fumarate hydratase class I
MCQDTGIVVAFVRIGMDVRWDATMSIADMVNEGVRRAYLDPDNTLRASIVSDPPARARTRTTRPQSCISIVPGNTVEVKLAARAAARRQGQVRDAESLRFDRHWVVKTLPTMGADGVLPECSASASAAARKRQC